MTEEEYTSRFNAHIKMYESLNVSVGISHKEVLKVVVNELITKRNAARKEEIRHAFDVILLAYYLDQKEFNKHVINQKPLK